MFYQINFSVDATTTLIDMGYEELESCLYSNNESTPMVLFIDKRKEQFYITDKAGMKDAQEIVKLKFNEEVMPVTKKTLYQWNQSQTHQ